MACKTPDLKNRINGARKTIRFRGAASVTPKIYAHSESGTNARPGLCSLLASPPFSAAGRCFKRNAAPMAVGQPGRHFRTPCVAAEYASPKADETPRLCPQYTAVPDRSLVGKGTGSAAGVLLCAKRCAQPALPNRRTRSLLRPSHGRHALLPAFLRCRPRDGAGLIPSVRIQTCRLPAFAVQKRRTS